MVIRTFLFLLYITVYNSTCIFYNTNNNNYINKYIKYFNIIKNNNQIFLSLEF